MKLLNIRLNDEDAKIVARLRRQGVNISSFVREALRSEDKRRQGHREPLDVDRMLADIYRAYPDPPDYKPREYNVHDAAQARQAIIAHLKRKRA
jgi:Arc/MetJ-type ribon-helix-helix transcriptional regulator